MTARRKSFPFPFLVLFFLLALLPSIASRAETPEVTPLKVTFVDVGHGDCVWIRTPFDGIRGNGIYEGYNIIIDGGPSSQRIQDIMPTLGLGWGSEIEWMFNSHAHADHYRGLIGMLEMYRVKNVVDPGYLPSSSVYGSFCWRALIEPDSNFYFPAVGEATIPGTRTLGEDYPVRLDWGDELEVEILYGSSDVLDTTVNDSSLIIRLEYNDVSFLFTGDAEGKNRPDSFGFHDPDNPIRVERILLDTYVTGEENRLASTILKIAHHGSETSSTNPFIEAVGAREGIIQAGHRHGLPNASVIRRFEEQGTRIWRTDRSPPGCFVNDTIVVTTDGSTYEIGYVNPSAEEAAELARARREATRRDAEPEPEGY